MNELCRICGQKFSAAPAATGTTSGTACTFTTPFRWGVRFGQSEQLCKLIIYYGYCSNLADLKKNIMINY